MAKIVLPPLGQNTGNQTATTGKIKLPPITSFGSKPVPVEFKGDASKLQNLATTTPTPTTTGGSTTIPVAPVPGKGGIESVIKGGIKAVEHPLLTLGSVGTGVLKVAFDGLSGGLKLAGADNAAKYVSENMDAVNDIFKAELEAKDMGTVGAVGQFVGEQIPYILAGTGAASLATKAVVPLVSGATKISNVQKIGSLTKMAAEGAGFIGLDQLTYSPEEKSRFDSLKTDLVVLGVLGSLGVGIKKLSDLKSIKAIRDYASKIKIEKPPISELESSVNKLKSELLLETGKTPQGLLRTETPLFLETPKEKPQIEIQPKTESVKVSRGQLPVGEGKVKTSSLEENIKTSIESAPEDIKSSLSTYNEMNNKDQIKKAVEYVSKNPDEAMAVLRGEKAPPKGILNNSIYVAMTKNAETNSELASKLASLRSTRYGQEIEILKEIDKRNPVKFMTDLVRNRIEVIGGNEKLATLRKTETSGIQKVIRKSNLAKTDWNSFIESITC